MTTKRVCLQTNDQEPIIALCTPRGSGAIALLRLCGQGAISVADKIIKLSSFEKLQDLPTHTIHYGAIISKNSDLVDQILIFLMKAPKTFTGQDTVEISCHNNPFIIEKIIELAIGAGARVALPGEFTKRAFLNKKIDLTQAESINEIINAQTEFALRKSMAQLKGSLSNFLTQLEYDLVGLLSLVEGSFEFLEEEQDDLNFTKLIKEKINSISSYIKELKTNFNQQKQIKDGVRVCILGWVNAGKSTLFNAILKKDRAIVTDKEGTTRDSIESNFYKNGNFWLLIDTAGLRKTEDFIEQEGIERSFEQAAQADIILLVFDLSKKLTENQVEFYKDIFQKYKEKIILVGNKSDIEKNDTLSNLIFLEKNEIIKVSATSNEGISFLESVIEKRIQIIFEKLNSPFLLNQRQYNLIVELDKKLDFIVENYMNQIQYELIAYHLKEMLEKLSDLTGKNVTENVLDRIFSDFCIGK
jgi:tRNA modification GTPase